MLLTELKETPRDKQRSQQLGRKEGGGEKEKGRKEERREGREARAPGLSNTGQLDSGTCFHCLGFTIKALGFKI